MYRLIIADDEQIVCRALEHKIQNYVEGVELLPSVHDGVDFLKRVEEYHPDIAIVDINMPGLGGLEAIELLRMKRTQIKIVIHTAYSDFEYAQKALKLGASDYLLKPGTKEGLVETIEKICRELDCEKLERQRTQKNQEAADNLRELVESKWMQSLLLGEIDEECQQKIKEYYQNFSGGVFTAWKQALCEKESRVSDMETIGKQVLKQMRELCHCIGICHREIVYLFLMMEEKRGERQTYEEWVLENINFVRKQLQKEHIEMVIGVGRPKRRKEEFVVGIQEAKAVLQGRDSPGVVSAQRGTKKKSGNFLAGQAQRGAVMLRQGRVEQCIREVKEKIQQMEECSEEILEEKKIGVLLYLLDLDRELRILKGKQQEPERVWDLWTEFRKVDTVQTMALWAEREIRDLEREQYTGKGNIYMRKAMTHLQKMYRRDLSLDELAREVGISSFYLSRLFKQEKNMTFVELLTNLRIREAVFMMREGEKSIREISGNVGYINMTYFYKVFKKTTGLTVGEMRRYL